MRPSSQCSNHSPRSSYVKPPIQGGPKKERTERQPVAARLPSPGRPPLHQPCSRSTNLPKLHVVTATCLKRETKEQVPKPQHTRAIHALSLNGHCFLQVCPLVNHDRNGHKFMLSPNQSVHETTKLIFQDPNLVREAACLK